MMLNVFKYAEPKIGLRLSLHTNTTGYRLTGHRYETRVIRFYVQYMVIYFDTALLGTGKTLTGVKLVYWCVRMNKQHAQDGGSHRHVLYCGPSNSSVDVAASESNSCYCVHEFLSVLIL